MSERKMKSSVPVNMPRCSECGGYAEFVVRDQWFCKRCVLNHESDLLWEIVDSNKGIEILRILRDGGAKNVRELLEAVGGSPTTVVKRKEEFAKAGLIEIERVYGGYGKEKQLTITAKGERLINKIDRFFGVK